MAPPDQQSTQNAVSSFLAGRPITAQLVNLAFTAVIGYIAYTAAQPVGGDLSGNLPNPAIAARAVTGGKIAQGTITADLLAPGVVGGGGGSSSSSFVPVRVAGGNDPVTTLPSDYYVCLNGPAQVNLEVAPLPGTTHVIKDCRSSPGGPITVSSLGGDAIDGQPSVTFTRPYQAMTVTFTPLGWKVL